MIHSYVKGKGKQGWSSVLAFKANKGQSDKEHGDRAPTVAVNKNGHLRFSNSVSGNKKYKFLFNVDRNKWYNITIEQRPNNEKVTRNFFLSFMSMTEAVKIQYYLLGGGGNERAKFL